MPIPDDWAEYAYEVQQQTQAHDYRIVETPTGGVVLTPHHKEEGPRYGILVVFTTGEELSDNDMANMVVSAKEMISETFLASVHRAGVEPFDRVREFKAHPIAYYDEGFAKIAREVRKLTVRDDAHD